MTRHKAIFLATLALTLLSCQRSTHSSKPLGLLTKLIMADREDRWHSLLEATEASPEGEIAIIGDERSALDLAGCFAASDTRDNATAAEMSDMLPDFAGETFSCIIDSTGAPFSGMQEDRICEIFVRHVLAAADTSVHVSPYDMEGIGHKEAAKMIIVTDPFLAHYGMADADSLLRHFNCGIPVISPMDVMFEKVLSQGRKVSTVGILCSETAADSGIYSGRFRQAAHDAGRDDIDCVVFPDEGGESPIKSFMDKYMQYSKNRPLDALVVDGTYRNLSNLKAELADLVSLMNEESVTYRKYISDGFLLLEGKTSVVEKCYDMTRERNMFSHHISMPAVTTCYNIPSTVLNDGTYILITSAYVQD